MNELMDEKAKRYVVLKRLSRLNAVESLYFNKEAEYKAYKEGMKEAFRMIEEQIDFCTINGYKFPILHIRDFIDKILGRKEV